MEHAPYFLCIAFIGVFLILPTWIWIQITERRARREYEKAKEAGRHEPVTILPFIDLQTCMGSGACVKACPEDVLSIIEGQAVAVNASACVGHGVCAVVCPVDAIQLVFGSEKRGIDIPEVGPDFQTNVPGLFVAGELGGMGLIANAVEQGSQAMNNAARGLKKGSQDHDVVIVGAGPAGIASALVAKQQGLSYKLLEQAVFGGAIRHYPRKKLVFMRPIEFPAYGRVKLSSLRKEELVELLEDVVNRGGLEVQQDERVEGIEPRPDGSFEVVSTRGRYPTSRVIIAVGRRGTPRKLGVPGEDAEKVAYALLEPELFTNDHVLVVGGGDSAVEAAMSLGEQDGNRVWLSYRRDKINRPKEKNIKRLREAVREGRVELVLSSNVQRIGVDRVVLEQQGEELVLPNDFVFVFAGGVLPTKFLKKAGIRIQRHYGKRIEAHVDEVAPAAGEQKEKRAVEPERPAEEPPAGDATRPMPVRPPPAEAPPGDRTEIRPIGAPIPDEDTAPRPDLDEDTAPRPDLDEDTAPRPEARPAVPLPHIPRTESTQPIPLTRKPTPGALEGDAPAEAHEDERPPLARPPRRSTPRPPRPRTAGPRPLPVSAGPRDSDDLADDPSGVPGRLVSDIHDRRALERKVREMRRQERAEERADRDRALRRVREVRQRMELEQPEETDPGLAVEEADGERTLLVPMTPDELARMAANTDEPETPEVSDALDAPPPADTTTPDPQEAPAGSALQAARVRARAGDPRGGWRLYIKAAREAAETGDSEAVLAIVDESEAVRPAAARALPPNQVARLERWLYIVHSQALLSLGRWAEAVGPLRAAIEAAESDADPRTLTRWRASLGRAYHRSGQYDDAVLFLDDALRSGHLEDAEKSATTRVLADIQLRRGDVAGSERLWRKALALARHVGSRHAEARAQRGLANCRVVQGRLHEGSELLGHADDLLVPDGDVRVRAGVLARMVEVDNAIGDFGNALYRGEILLDLTSRNGLDDHLAEAAALLADTLLLVGLVDEARDAAVQALSLLPDSGDDRAIFARLGTVRALCNLEAWDDAAETLEDAPSLPDSVVDDPRGQALALRARIVGADDPQQARALAMQALNRPRTMLAIRAAPVRLDAARALLNAGYADDARNAVKRGLKLLQGTGAYGLKLDLLITMYLCHPDPRVAKALVQTAAKLLETLPAHAARAFAQRPVLEELLARR